jgi:hypothetical protein
VGWPAGASASSSKQKNLRGFRSPAFGFGLIIDSLQSQEWLQALFVRRSRIKKWLRGTDNGETTSMALPKTAMVPFLVLAALVAFAAVTSSDFRQRKFTPSLQLPITRTIAD